MVSCSLNFSIYLCLSLFVAWNFSIIFFSILQEARVAIERVVIPKGQPVELLPRPPNIILLQKDLVRQYKLHSKKIGTEPDERLRIFPFQNAGDEDGVSSEGDDADGEFDEFSSLDSERNGSPYIVNRLPLLPE